MVFAGLLFAAAAAEGCRGEVERVFFDDLDASGTDGSTSGPDATSTDGATGDGSQQGDGGGSDAGDASDAADAADAADACPAVANMIDHCGVCGNVCYFDFGVSTPTCDGTKCQYGTCKAGRANCNVDAGGPDLDGCECAGNGCCAGACQTAHSNGAGQSFYDCVALGTYNVTQATAACNAWLLGDAGTCSSIGCTANAGTAVCVNSGGTCKCWKYDPGTSGSNGTVSTSTSSCICPNASHPAWN
jgi:hypothetical protein